MKDEGHLALQGLLGTKRLTTLLDKFAQAMNTPLLVMDSAGNPFAQSLACSYCQMMETAGVWLQRSREDYAVLLMTGIKNWEDWVVTTCHAGRLQFLVPIVLNNTLLGAVVGCQRELNKKSEEELFSAVKLVSEVTAELAYSELKLKDLYEETIHCYEELNLLYDISKVVGNMFNVEINQTIVEKALEVIGAEKGSLMLIDKQSNELRIVAASGLEDEIRKNTRIKVGERIAGRVAKEGKPLIVENIEEASHLTTERAEKYKTKSFISLPITSVPLDGKEEVMGVLNLTDKKRGDFFTARDLKLLSAITSQTAISMDLKRYTEELLQATAEKERFLKELQIARDIQQSFLPETPPQVEGIDLAAMNSPAQQVGGDFYDFIPVTQDKLGLVMADVSGKGISAALFMALSQSLIRANARGNPSPERVLRQTNGLILEEVKSGMFVTVFYAILDTKKGTLTYVSAGHNPPIWLNRNTGDCKMLEAEGMALGVMEDIRLVEKQITLGRDDMLVLYTDGVIEAINQRKEEFGEERFISVIKESHTLAAKDLIEKINQEVFTFVGEEPQFDDLTLMVLKFV